MQFLTAVLMPPSSTPSMPVSTPLSMLVLTPLLMPVVMRPSMILGIVVVERLLMMRTMLS
jgi:hypothetical protein